MLMIFISAGLVKMLGFHLIWMFLILVVIFPIWFVVNIFANPDYLDAALGAFVKFLEVTCWPFVFDSNEIVLIGMGLAGVGLVIVLIGNAIWDIVSESRAASNSDDTKEPDYVI